MQHIPLEDRFFEGAVSFEHGEAWIKPWRIRFDERKLFPPQDGAPPYAEKCSGVRLRFKSDSAVVNLEVKPVDDVRIFDISTQGEFIASVTLDKGEGSVRFENLPSGNRIFELWLPQSHAVHAIGLLVEDDTQFEVPHDPRPKWVTYGSSISQCGAARSPAHTWPAVTARLRNLNLVSLGFGGNCHLEPMVALTIRDLPANLITLKLGINIYGACSLSPRTFEAAVIGFVQIIRDKHKDTPIALVSPITCPSRETTKNAVGLSLRDMRILLEDAASRLRTHGDENIRFIDGRILLGEELAERYLPDGLHPNADGYEIIGRRFAEKVISEYPFLV